MLTGALILSAAASCHGAPRKGTDVTVNEQTPPQETIGVATREADGTIVLTLRAEGPGGIVGDGQLRYPPDHKDYAMIARHVGPIPPGGSVFVKPFPAQ